MAKLSEIFDKTKKGNEKLNRYAMKAFVNLHNTNKKIDSINQLEPMAKEWGGSINKPYYAKLEKKVENRKDGLIRAEKKHKSRTKLKEDTMADDNTKAELLQSIIDQKPLETKNTFDSLLKDRIADMLDVYKDHLATNVFGGEKEEDEPEETPEGESDEGEEELSDEEIEELIGGLSDEELEELIADLDDEGDPQEEPEPEEKPTDEVEPEEEA